jgi:hypothetical protein
MQNYISGDLKFVSAVVAGSVHNKQDQLLGILPQFRTLGPATPASATGHKQAFPTF